jgi:hypothetical protein
MSVPISDIQLGAIFFFPKGNVKVVNLISTQAGTNAYWMYADGVKRQRGPFEGVMPLTRFAKKAHPPKVEP